MEAITKLMNGLDFTKLVPNLDKVLGIVRPIAVIAMLIGPICMLILGAIYLLKPPAEANRKFGFRTYFGMGSVEAWRFTQKIAGLVYGGVGLLLTLIMGILCLTSGGKALDALAMMAFRSLIWEFVVLLVSYCAIVGVVTYFFDKEGDRRRDLPKLKV